MTEEVNPIDEERNAIDLIARTPEGRLLNRHLRRVLEFVPSIADSDSALRQWSGRRSLAQDLMRLMAEGIEATRDGTGTSTDNSILGGAHKPVSASGRPSGAARRVTVERGDGWLPDDAFNDDGTRKSG